MRTTIVIGFTFLILHLSRSTIHAQTAAGDLFHELLQARALLASGYTERNPEKLLLAAEILSENKVKPAQLQFRNIKYAEEGDSTTFSRSPVSLDIETILSNFFEMGGDSSLAAALRFKMQEEATDSLSKNRGRKHSPYAQEFRLDAGSHIEIFAVFEGRALAEIFAAGDGKSSIELRVYDNRNKLITYDKPRPDQCYASFTPKQTADYKIVVRNRGKLTNYCLLLTN